MNRILVGIVCLLVMGPGVKGRAQLRPDNYKDTLLVKAANLKHMSRYITYYVDSTHEKGVQEINKLQEAFRNWPLDQSLNLGMNPHPVWLRLNVQNIADHRLRFWLSFYTHADSVLVFKRSRGQFLCIDTLSYNIAQSERKVVPGFWWLQRGWSLVRPRNFW